MKKLYDNPSALLIITGVGLGLNFPLGKLALAAGISAPLWAAYISLGAGIVLFVLARAQGPFFAAPGIGRFSVISGFLSYVMPNLLVYSVIPKIGSGFTGLMFALSPVLTALLSVILNVRPPNRLGLIGIALGLVGAITIALGRAGSVEGGGAFWLMLGFLIPCFLAVGNIYRTVGWPKGATPVQLGSLTNLAAVPFLLAVSLALAGKFDFEPFAKVPWLLLAQLVCSTLMLVMFFRLQQIGGPTYLSQIGYVGAGVGLFAGVAFLGEVYPISVWLGGAIIVAGIAISTWSARSP